MTYIKNVAAQLEKSQVMPLLCIYLHTVLEAINKDHTDRIPAEQAAGHLHRA